jgi:hypothetical protein
MEFVLRGCVHARVQALAASGRCRERIQRALEGTAGTLHRARGFQEARFVVQRQNEAVDLEGQLAGSVSGSRCPSSMASCTARFMAACQVFTVATSASRTGPGRSSNSTAPLMYMQPESISMEVRLHPVVEQGAQPGQATRLLQRG